MEAPPSVMSTYLGESMTEYLEAFMAGDLKEYVPKTTQINLGVDDLPEITAPAEDRNRTSPFPYGGHRFEFRACGSSQNVSLVNTVLATMMANEFREIADEVEKGATAEAVAQELLKAHIKCVFNGNGYDPAWPDKAVEKGVCRIDSGIDAICKLSDQKNLDLFVQAGVFGVDEVVARETVLLELYMGVVEMEIQVMIDMINQHVIPSMKSAGMPDYVSKLEGGITKLAEGLKNLHDANGDPVTGAHLAHEVRFGTMGEVRAVCDDAEGKCPASLWTLATYKELFFVDLNENINRFEVK
jgi:glutamine synthetase